jgi:bacillopeptidase F
MLICWTGLAGAQSGVISPDLEAVLQSMGPDEEVAVILSLADQVDLGQFRNSDKGLRRANMVRALKSKANAAQAPLKAYLEGKGVKRAITLWAINGMAVTGTADTIQALENQVGIESIRLDDTLLKPEPSPGTLAAPEWNLSAIRAPELWSAGYTGVGMVVASMDTGVDPDHPDLTAKWRGGNNSWYDPNGEHNSPYDADGHGTQTMSLMVGGGCGRNGYRCGSRRPVDCGKDLQRCRGSRPE